MQKRGNEVPDLERVARQVGIGAVVFNDLVNDRVKNVEFDWARVLDFEGDSGPYVQYCGVRCASLIRKYGKPIPQKMSVELNSPEEIELIRTLLAFDVVLKNAFASFRPHILAGFLIEVCHKFSQFYSKQRVLGEDPPLESSRMVLVEAVFKILEKGLGLLSIELPEAM
jgi:arginyl-tRNA synthetase